MVRERLRDGFPGVPALLLVLAVGAGLLLNVVRMASERIAPPGVGILIVLGSIVVMIFLLSGFFIVQPNEGRVLQFFGTYVGTSRKTGLQWLVPFYSKRRISLRVRSFESAHLKVNDREGNPIEIGAVVVWKVVDTAEAAFEVDNYESYVKVQSEAALRNLATTHAYDSHVEDAKIGRAHV